MIPKAHPCRRLPSFDTREAPSPIMRQWFCGSIGDMEPVVRSTPQKASLAGCANFRVGWEATVTGREKATFVKRSL